MRVKILLNLLFTAGLLLISPHVVTAQVVGNYQVTFSTDASAYTYSAAAANAQISATIRVISATSTPVQALSLDLFVLPVAELTTPFNLAAATQPYCQGTTDTTGSTTCAFSVSELADTGNGGYALVATYTPFGATARTYSASPAQVFSVSGLPTAGTPDPGTGTPPATPGTTTTPGTGTTTPASSSDPVSIPNPIKCNDATCLISQIIRAILGVIAVVATIMFVWGGVMMLTSGGNEKRVTQAKETLVWAAIGLVVIIISWAVIKFVLEMVINGGAKTT